ncbi:MAG: AraC family transcriptional regulator [Puia sp.]
MIRSVREILNNSYSSQGKATLLRNNVENILIAALEQVGKEELGKLILSPADKEALTHVKELIEKHCPIYLGNDVLVAKAYPKLNAFKLSYGFKQMFNINPYDYYLLLRLNKGQELLEAGETVTSVANELEYESATTFIRAFKKRFGTTPKQYQTNED